MHSKMSKQLGADELLSEGSNKIRKSNESLAVLAKSNPSSFNSNDQESKVARNDLTAVIKEIKEDLLREEAQLKFLAGIQKIPSL